MREGYYAHQIAKTCYEDGEWKVMFGPVPGNKSRNHFFIHHDCKEVNENGAARWTSWYAALKEANKSDRPWCSHCDSEPSDEILSLSILVETQ